MGSFVSSFLCTVVGFAYPTYASFKAIESEEKDDDTQWLTYWIVFSIFTVMESVTDVFISWFPFYFEIKLLILLALQMPGLQLSATIYKLYLRPFFSKHQEKLDAMIDDAQTQLKEKAVDVAFKKGL